MQGYYFLRTVNSQGGELVEEVRFKDVIDIELWGTHSFIFRYKDKSAVVLPVHNIVGNWYMELEEGE